MYCSGRPIGTSEIRDKINVRCPLHGGSFARGFTQFIHTTCHYRYDSNNPLMVGDVGLAGVAIDSVEDMKVCV